MGWSIACAIGAAMLGIGIVLYRTIRKEDDIVDRDRGHSFLIYNAAYGRYRPLMYCHKCGGTNTYNACVAPTVRDCCRIEAVEGLCPPQQDLWCHTHGMHSSNVWQCPKMGKNPNL